MDMAQLTLVARPYAAEVPSAARRDALDQLAAEVVDCRRCDRLVAWREQVAAEPRASYREQRYWGRPVTGFGDPDASVLIVGLAPAAHGANRTGRVFTGDRSGDVLFASLWRTGFAQLPTSTSSDDGQRLRDAWITMPVRCAPPGNAPTPAERVSCEPFLRRELALLDGVRVVVALGAFGYAAVARLLEVARPRPKFAHGLEVAARLDGRPLTLLCSFHVSQQNTFTGRLTPPMLDDVFLRARALADLPDQRGTR